MPSLHRLNQGKKVWFTYLVQRRIDERAVPTCAARAGGDRALSYSQTRQDLHIKYDMNGWTHPLPSPPFASMAAPASLPARS